MQEPWVQSLGWEDPLEKGMATHCSILVWRIPWTEEPAGLQSTGSKRVGHDWSNEALPSTHWMPGGTQSPTPTLPVLTTTGVSGGVNRCWWRSTWVRRPLEASASKSTDSCRAHLGITVPSRDQPHPPPQPWKSKFRCTFLPRWCVTVFTPLGLRGWGREQYLVFIIFVCFVLLL